MSNKINSRIEKSNIKMMMDKEWDLEFYGHFSQKINFIKNNSEGMTMAVTYRRGELTMYYNEKFMDTLTDEQLNFVLIHEFLHLLSNHVIRTKEANHEHQMANIAQDYVINEGIYKDICSVNKMVQIPDTVLRIPTEYKGHMVYEFVYDYIKDVEKQVNKVLNKNGVSNADIEQLKKDIMDALDKLAKSGQLSPNSNVGVDMSQRGQQPQGGDGDEQSQGGDGDEQSQCGDGGEQSQGGDGGEQSQCGDGGEQSQGGDGGSNPLDEAIEKNKGTVDKINDIIKNDPFFNNRNDSKPLNDLKKSLAKRNYNFDIHISCSADEATIAGEKVRGIVNALKNRGLVKGEVEALLEGLYKTKVDYIKLIKKMATWIKGTQREKTYSKPNRRGFINLKGRKKYASVINCILDTSGSMSDEFDVVLSHIFKDGYQINLIQCDAVVQDYKVINNKNELKTLAIKGLGGTVLQPGLDYIKSDSKLSKNNTLILTDGYTDVLDTNNMKKVLILTTGVKSPVVDESNVRQIIIDENELINN